MNHLIRNEKEYSAVLKKIEKLFNAAPNTAEGEELEFLMLLVEKYEEKKYPMPTLDPISAIKAAMDLHNLKQADLIPYIGSRSRVSEILSGKRTLTLNMIRRLVAGLGIPAEILIQEQKQDVA